MPVFGPRSSIDDLKDGNEGVQASPLPSRPGSARWSGIAKLVRNPLLFGKPAVGRASPAQVSPARSEAASPLPGTGTGKRGSLEGNERNERPANGMRSRRMTLKIDNPTVLRRSSTSGMGGSGRRSLEDGEEKTKFSKSDSIAIMGSRRATLRDLGVQVQQALRNKTDESKFRNREEERMMGALQAIMKGHHHNSPSDEELSSDSDKDEPHDAGGGESPRRSMEQKAGESSSRRGRSSRGSLDAPGASGQDLQAQQAPDLNARFSLTDLSTATPSTSTGPNAKPSSQGSVNEKNALSAVLSAEQLHAAATGTPRPGHQRDANRVDHETTDVRFLAVRNARVIQQLIQEAGDEPSRCHERWLRRRLPREQNKHRDSLGVKPADERIEIESRKTATRLKKRRREAITDRLRDLPALDAPPSVAHPAQQTVSKSPRFDDSANPTQLKIKKRTSLSTQESDDENHPYLPSSALLSDRLATLVEVSSPCNSSISHSEHPSRRNSLQAPDSGGLRLDGLIHNSDSTSRRSSLTIDVGALQLDASQQQAETPEPFARNRRVSIKAPGEGSLGIKAPGEGATSSRTQSRRSSFTGPTVVNRIDASPRQSVPSRQDEHPIVTRRAERRATLESMQNMVEGIISRQNTLESEEDDFEEEMPLLSRDPTPIMSPSATPSASPRSGSPNPFHLELADRVELGRPDKNSLGPPQLTLTGLRGHSPRHAAKGKQNEELDSTAGTREDGESPPLPEVREKHVKTGLQTPRSRPGSPPLSEIVALQARLASVACASTSRSDGDYINSLAHGVQGPLMRGMHPLDTCAPTARLDADHVKSLAHGVKGPLMRGIQSQDDSPKSLRRPLPFIKTDSDAASASAVDIATSESEDGLGLLPGGAVSIKAAALTAMQLGRSTPEFSEFPGAGDLPKRRDSLILPLPIGRREALAPLKIEEGVPLVEGMPEVPADASQWSKLSGDATFAVEPQSDEKKLEQHRDSVLWCKEHHKVKTVHQSTPILHHDPFGTYHMVTEYKIPQLPKTPAASYRPLRRGSESPTNHTMEELYSIELTAKKRSKLPEVPRLREKFRDRRVILGGNWRNEVTTVKRFHLEVATRLGLSEEDWNQMGSLYMLNVADLERAAEKKEERERQAAAARIQQKWNTLQTYRKARSIRVQRRSALGKLQKWWHRKSTFQRPVERRLAQKPMRQMAVFKIQAAMLAWRDRRRLAFQRDVHRIVCDLEKLKEGLGGEDFYKLVRLQARVRGWKARKDYAKLLEAKKKQKEEEDKASEMSQVRPKTANRRMSFAHFSSISQGRRGTLHAFDVGSRLNSRRQSEFRSHDRESLSPAIGFQVESRPKTMTPIAADPLRALTPVANSVTHEEDSDSDSDDDEVAANLHSISDRAVSTTPLGKRLKRPLDPGYARMAGLRKSYVNVAEETQAAKKDSPTIDRILLTTPVEALSKRNSSPRAKESAPRPKESAAPKAKEVKPHRTATGKETHPRAGSRGNASTCKEGKVLQEIPIKAKPVPILKLPSHMKSSSRPQSKGGSVDDVAGNPMRNWSPRSELTLSPNTEHSVSPGGAGSPKSDQKVYFPA